MKKCKLTVLIVLVLMLTGSLSVYAFPYNEGYSYGITSSASNQQAANDFVLQEWEDWKNIRITESGAGGYKRVQRCGADNYDTVSEGQAYGLLFAVYFDEQNLFDDLYGYVQLYLNDNGLMSWQIDSSGNIVGMGGHGGASDADEDIALALIFAHNVWGSNGSVNYEQEARNILDSLYNHCVEQGTYVFKPGDSWGGSNVTNPSYYSPAWYRIFADFTGNHEWLNVADKCFEIVENVKNHNAGTGLVPDWCTADGTEAQGQGYDFTYDAIRYPWRTAIDYSWFGEERAKTNCDMINSFFKNNGVSNIVDGYSITGNVLGSYHNSTFVSMIAASSMTGFDQNFAQELFEENKEVKETGNYSYYGSCLRLFALLYTSGNFPNLYEIDSGTPEVIPGDVNGDGNIDSLDYILLRRYLTGTISEFPSEHGFTAADMNEDSVINSLDYILLQRTITG